MKSFFATRRWQCTFDPACECMSPSSDCFQTSERIARAQVVFVFELSPCMCCQVGSVVFGSVLLSFWSRFKGMFCSSAKRCHFSCSEASVSLASVPCASVSTRWRRNHSFTLRSWLYASPTWQPRHLISTTRVRSSSEPKDH